MLVRQRKDVFIRRYGPVGYITNQLTRRDRVYDEFGAVFLEAISRQPQDVETIVRRLLGIFDGADPAEVQRDFLEFASDLEADGFLVSGDSPAALDEADRGFTYATETPKTILAWASDDTKDGLARPTDDVMTEYFRDHPTIFGAHFELTSRCNERCIHCYQPKEQPQHADVAMVLDAFDQLGAMGTTSLTLSGGEPTLHPDFVTILRAARRHDLIVNVLTNGLALCDETIAALKEVNASMVQVSLYSMDPAVHDSITRVQGSHTRTLATIERLIAADVPVQVSTPLMKNNRGTFREVARWCHERKIRVLSDFIMMAMSNFDQSNLQQRLSLDETADAIQDIIEKDDEYQLLIDTPQRVVDLETLRQQPVCGVAVDNACFAADGSIYPCAGFQGYILGNVRERSVRDIWENSERARSLRTIRKDAFPQCLDCQAREFCVMCLVRNYNESGGDLHDVADHFCQVSFLNRDLVLKHRAARGATAGTLGAGAPPCVEGRMPPQA